MSGGQAERTREAEEEGDVIGSAHIAAGVQGENAALGHEVVHHAEDALLHLSSVLRAQDHHLPRPAATRPSTLSKMLGIDM